MRIIMYLFGIFCFCNQVVLANPETLNALRELASKNEQWQALFGNTSLLNAVNHELVDSEQPIKSGDEVAFFPPVTGG